MLVYYLPLSILLYGVTFASGCPQFLADVCRCEDLNNGVKLDCTNVANAKRTVEMLKSNRTNVGLIQELRLQNAKLKYRSAKYFAGLYIKKLDLSNNQLTDINPAAFDGLGNVLEELIIRHNNLTSIPTQAIATLNTLQHLDLSNNSIQDLAAENILPPLPKLYDLNLADNHICEVHKSVFDNVKNSLHTLNFGRNCLRSVPASAIRGFKKLMALHFHGNNITALNLLSFMNLPVLNLLNLASNQITTIHRQAFLNVPMLKYLYLSGNRVTEIYPHQFSSFEQLEMLDFSENFLAEIVTDAFSNLQNLRQLYMAENRISNIKPNSFTNSSVVILSLASNRLTELKEGVFDGMAKLQQISLKDNEIHTIAQDVFYNCPSLVMIDLSENDLTDIAPTTFLTQMSILLIDLSRNKIIRTPYGAFNRKTKTVLLQENPLVCTEKIHMLQGGVGVYIPNSEDAICGGKKTTTPSIHANKSMHSVMQLPTTPVTNFQRKAVYTEANPTKAAANNRPTQHIHTIRPPVIKPLPYIENTHNTDKSLPRTINNGKLSIHSITETYERIQPVIQRPNTENDRQKVSGKNGGNAEIITSRSRGNFGFNKPRIHTVNPNITNSPVEEVKKNNEYTKIEDSKLYPQPVPFLNNPTPLAPAFPTYTTKSKTLSTVATTEATETTVILNSQMMQIKTIKATNTEIQIQTLPPNIVVAQGTFPQPTADQNVEMDDKKIEKMELEETGGSERREDTTTLHTKNNAYEAEHYDRQSRIATPTIIMIVCLSTVAIVMSAVFVGLCVAKHKSMRLYAESTTSSAAAARTNAYVAAQAAQAAQMNMLYGSNTHRNRSGSLNYVNDNHAWIYAPGSYGQNCYK